MPRIIKPNHIVSSDDVVYIPDTSETEELFAEEEEYELEDGESETDTQEEPEEENFSARAEQLTRSERERLLAEAHAEAARIREEAKRQGYEDAYSDLSSRAGQCIQDVYHTLDEMQDRQQEYFLHYERELKHLALEIAQKVLQKTIEEDKTAMRELIKNAVLSIKQSDWVTVELSDTLTALITDLKQEFAQAGRNIDFVPQRDAAPDTCVIRSSQGDTDISVPEQLHNLKQIFDKADGQ